MVENEQYRNQILPIHGYGSGVDLCLHGFIALEMAIWKTC